jgi:hypothetical protein
MVKPPKRPDEEPPGKPGGDDNKGSSGRQPQK